jgi:PEP-CTERM motif
MRFLSRTLNLSMAVMGLTILTTTAAQAQTISATFSGSYTLASLGTPSGVPSSLGGLTVKAGDTSKLLIGGSANTGSGAIYEVPVTRDGSGHITGFSGAGTNVASAPRIDGGLQYGPGGVLFATTYSNNNLLQYKSGSAAPDKTIDLTGLGIASSTGTIQFTPDGRAVIASYSTGNFYSITMTADGSGTYDVAVGASVSGLNFGPEGIVYVPSGSPVFPTLDASANWMLVSEYNSNRVSAYKADANWLPIGATRLDFITGVSGAEGATLDPLTGDFLFSTFGGGNQVLTVQGFVAPTPATAPEPGTLALLALGGTLAIVKRRRK